MELPKPAVATTVSSNRVFSTSSHTTSNTIMATSLPLANGIDAARHHVPNLHAFESSIWSLSKIVPANYVLAIYFPICEWFNLDMTLSTPATTTAPILSNGHILKMEHMLTIFYRR